MNDSRRPAPQGHSALLYAVCGAVLIAFVGIGVLAYERQQTSAQARMLADDLIAAFVARGYPAPDQETVVGLFGTDGGAVCADPAGALKQALRNDAISNGAGGPGQRPVIGQGSVVRAELLVLEVYCPDRVPAVRDAIDDLNLIDDDEEAA